MNGSATLFGDLEPPKAEERAASGPVAQIALEQGVDRALDYIIPPRLANRIHVGMRMRVPLGRGNRAVRGWVVALKAASDVPRLKNLLGIDDERILISPPVMELARWIGRYYSTPLGVVLESVIPAAVKKKIGIGYSNIVRLALEPGKFRRFWRRPKPASAGRSYLGCCRWRRKRESN